MLTSFPRRWNKVWCLLAHWKWLRLVGVCYLMVDGFWENRIMHRIPSRTKKPAAATTSLKTKLRSENYYFFYWRSKVDMVVLNPATGRQSNCTEFQTTIRLVSLDRTFRELWLQLPLAFTLVYSLRSSVFSLSRQLFPEKTFWAPCQTANRHRQVPNISWGVSGKACFHSINVKGNDTFVCHDAIRQIVCGWSVEGTDSRHN